MVGRHERPFRDKPFRGGPAEFPQVAVPAPRGPAPEDLDFWKGAQTNFGTETTPSESLTEVKEMENRKPWRHKKVLIDAIRSSRIWSKESRGGALLCRKRSVLRGGSAQVKLYPC